MDTILLSEDTPEDKQIPVFFFRETYGTGIASFDSKLRLNGTVNPAEPNYGDRIYGSRNHNLFNLINPSVYYDEHPEYFSGPGYTQPCLTNPDVLKIVTDNARKYLQDNPKVKLMSLCQEDNSQFCRCDECNHVLAEEEGVLSGVLLRFVNAIATELKDEFPDVLFTTFAYSVTNDCTKKTKPADNVMIIYSDIGACMSHPIRDNVTNGCMPYNGWGYPKDAEILDQWASVTDNIIVWDYTTNFDNYDAYVANFTVMLDNLKFFAENGVDGVFEQSCVVETVDFPELRRYIMGKILWDPNMTEEEYWAHIDDFLEGFYGPGWKNIRAYIDFTEAYMDDICFCLYEDHSSETMFFPINPTKMNPDETYPSELTADMIRNYTEVDWTKYYTWYTDIEDLSYFEKGTEWFNAALEAAETDEQRNRIEKAALQIEYVESSYRYLITNRYGKCSAS